MIRDFARTDQAAVKTLILDGLRERWGADFDESYNSDLDDIGRNYQDCGAEVVVVDSDHGIVATGTLLIEGPNEARIVRMSVAASERRNGLGREVVNELVARARRHDLTVVTVLTDTPWTSAVALYQACGFEEMASDETETRFVMTL